MFHLYRQWRTKRIINRLDHDEAAQLMRYFAYNKGVQSPVVLMLAERALATAPEGHRYNLALWVRMLRAGRKIKVATYPAEFTVPDQDLEMDPELEHAVREALAGWDA
jgi:hypothetical protein